MNYEYALLRYRHSPSSGERVNIGVVMWVRAERLLRYQVQERYRRLSSFFQDAFDGTAYRQSVRHLLSRFEAVNSSFGVPFQLEISKRMPGELADILKLLVRDPDSCFQWSSIRSGVTSDPAARLQKLFAEFVLRYEDTSTRGRRDAAAIWSGVESRLMSNSLIGPGKMETGIKLAGAHGYSWTFRTGWQNGTRQVLEPVSFDYLDAKRIVEKANTWLGRLQSLSKVSQFQMTAVVAPPQREDLLRAYRRAVSILGDSPEIRKVVPENHIDEFVPTIEEDLRRHNT
jgi:DUF3037 family protein